VRSRQAGNRRLPQQATFGDTPRPPPTRRAGLHGLFLLGHRASFVAALGRTCVFLEITPVVPVGATTYNRSREWPIRDTMRQLSLHGSAIAAWGTAKLEACRLGDDLIYPRHLLVGLLALLCGSPAQAADPDMTTVVEQTRRLVGLSREQADEALQGLRLALRPMGSAHSPEVVHRSKESRRIFARAAQLALAAGSERVTSVHLAQAIGEHLPTDQGERWLPGLARDFHEAGAFAEQSLPAAQEESARGTPEAGASTTPTMDRLARDLTALARAGRLVPLVGRQKEIMSIARHLLRTSKRNVLVVGDAGVGKTAIIEGLAQYFASGSAPEPLASLRIVQISLGDVVAGTRYRGDLEERLQGLVDEAIRTPDLVLFLDEVHLAAGGGTGSDNPMDVANILKPALARAEFRCIGATTTSEYERFVKPDSAFTRRFQLVRVPEPSQEEAIQICTGWARRIEDIQHVRFELEAIRASVELSTAYLRDKALPDKAIDLLENAATLEKISTLSPQPDLPSESPGTIGRQQIEAALKEQYGVILDASEALEVGAIEECLRAWLVGQDAAIGEIVGGLNNVLARRDTVSGPLGVLLFTGPTGVGKTYAAERIGEVVSRTQHQAFARFNMNEYRERYDLARMIGAAPGLIGHEEAGALFRFAHSNPQGVILLDEIEKAHPEVRDYFQQIFDTGEVRDSRGRVVSFRSYLFLLTCNLPPDVAAFRPSGPRTRGVTEGMPAEWSVRKLLASYLGTEFLARVNCAVAFQPLVTQDFEALFDRGLQQLGDRLAKEGMGTVSITQSARAHLLAQCSAHEENARGFLHRFELLLTTPVLRSAREAASGGKTILVDCREERISLTS